MRYRQNTKVDILYGPPVTRSLFDIGLDPPLIQFNSRELEYRQTMTRYATYDCLSIHHLLFSMNETGNQQSSFNSPFLSLSFCIYIYIYG